MWRSWALVTGLVTLAPFTGERARAQVVDTGPPALAVAVGDRVRVGGDGRPWRVGSVIALDSAGFGFSMEGGGDVYLPWASVPVERSAGRRTRAKGGALIGVIAGAGLLTGVALADGSGSGEGFVAGPSVSTGRAVGLALVLGGLAGGALGALIGSSISTEVWAPVEPGRDRLSTHRGAPSLGPRSRLAWTVTW